MAASRGLKQLQAFNVIKLVIRGKSHQPAAWDWTGLKPDELILPSLDRVFVTK
jgi:hypothetical protein